MRTAVVLLSIALINASGIRPSAEQLVQWAPSSLAQLKEAIAAAGRVLEEYGDHALSVEVKLTPVPVGEMDGGIIKVLRKGRTTIIDHLGHTIVQDGDLRIAVHPDDSTVVVMNASDADAVMFAASGHDLLGPRGKVERLHLVQGSTFRITRARSDVQEVQFSFDAEGALRSITSRMAKEQAQFSFPLDAIQAPVVLTIKYGTPRKLEAGEMRRLVDPLSKYVSFSKEGWRGVGPCAGFHVHDSRLRTQ